MGDTKSLLKIFRVLKVLQEFFFKFSMTMAQSYGPQTMGSSHWERTY